MLTAANVRGGWVGMPVRRKKGGAIGLVETGDLIEISIPERTINLAVSCAPVSSRSKIATSEPSSPKRCSPAI